MVSPWIAPLLMLAPLVLVGCEKKPDRIAITETRTVSEYERTPKVNAYPGERFGLHPMAWSVPEGWRQVGPASMRFVDMRFGPGDEGEAYVSALAGDGGGLLANVNRWRAEMGLEPVAEADLQAMDTMTFLGGRALVVDLSGDFTPVGATEPRRDHRLIGLIQPSEELTFFAKMTGPEELVERERPKFEQFLRSVRIRPRSSS